MPVPGPGGQRTSRPQSRRPRRRRVSILGFITASIVTVVCLQGFLHHLAILSHRGFEIRIDNTILILPTLVSSSSSSNTNADDNNDDATSARISTKDGSTASSFLSLTSSSVVSSGGVGGVSVRGDNAGGGKMMMMMKKKSFKLKRTPAFGTSITSTSNKVIETDNNAILPINTPSVLYEQKRPFPRWGNSHSGAAATDNGNDVNGISLDTVVDFAHGVLNYTASIFPLAKSNGFPETPYVVHFDFDTSTTASKKGGGGIYVSRTIRQRTLKDQIKYRVQPTEKIMIDAYEHLIRTVLLYDDNDNDNNNDSMPVVVSSKKKIIQTAEATRTRMMMMKPSDDPNDNDDDGTTDDDNDPFYRYSPQRLEYEQEDKFKSINVVDDRDKWPNLKHLVLLSSQAQDDDGNDGSTTATTTSTSTTGFPFLFFYGDYKGSCSYRNWNRKHSVPILSYCGHVQCQYAFPFPTYKTISDSKRSSEEWQIQFKQYNTEYPWNQKQRQVVWRGSLTGQLNDKHVNPRAMLATYIANYTQNHHHNNNNKKAGNSNNLFDIGLTRIPSLHNLSSNEINTRYGGIVSRMDMKDFQNYVAILDIDGNSWSSRFGTLLCYNSVVMKVEPQFVDYFHFRDLQAWKHYVPVKYDLSDLVAKSKWVSDPANTNTVQRIIENSNKWCESRMVYSSLVNDVLDIWDEYVGLLDENDPLWLQKWSSNQQQQQQQQHTSTSSSSMLTSPEFDMVKLTSLHNEKSKYNT